jgi:predicted phage replisome organizer
MSEVKWIKLTVDMFDNRKIKYLRTLPEGNNIVLIWVMLLTMAGRCDSGGMIFLTENIPYTGQVLANELGFETSTVELALKILASLGMISEIDGYIQIEGWDDHQSADKLEQIREQNRIRKQKERERKQIAMSRDGHVTVTQCHATDIDKEIDKDIDKDIKVRRFTPPTPEEVQKYCTESGHYIDADAFVDFYNSKNWMVGKNKMKDWKSAVRNWERRDKEHHTERTNRFNNFEQQREGIDPYALGLFANN